ncbi:uncharacterized protein K02A2.6-like [Nerophis ophidion]|uniref:uncharacterized protein K02A2.6-like n=1 Tax=Nerophis ophidion TaxID=159077 RepID=UPI002ADFFB44|nr:uncharacterized protein K02A2.6-like [Nerophis ophidion]
MDTDHKPLELIFKNQKSKPPERWALRLQPYKFKVVHKAGKSNPADYMSRHPQTLHQCVTTDDMDTEIHVRFIAKHAIPKAMTLQEVKKETVKDPVLLHLKEVIHSGDWTHLYDGPSEFDHSMLKAFHNVREELAVLDDGSLILRGNRLVLPQTLQTRALALAHEGHQGVVKTKQLLREKVWFPGIDKQSEELVSQCIPCQSSVLRTEHQPLQMSELPTGPWKNVSVDFCGPLPCGDYLFVMLDEYSRFPFVEITSSTSAHTIIPVMDKILSLVGTPEVVKRDNGPPFSGNIFGDFAHYLGFHHRKITPYWPQANAVVESFNRPLIKAVHTAMVEGKPWKQELYKFLRNYRATPPHTTNRSPAELFFGRPMSIKLPSISHPTDDNDLRQTDAQRKTKMKLYADERRNAVHSQLKQGDVVLIRQRRTGKMVTPFNPKPYKVISVKGTMVTAKRHGHEVTRHRSLYKLRKHEPSVPLNCDSDSSEDDDEDSTGYQVHDQGRQRQQSPNQDQRRYPIRADRRLPRRLLD